MTDAARGEAVVLDRVGFRYRPDAWVLRDCSVRVGRGRVLAVLGPNGRGKTTLLNVLAGGLVPHEGTVTVAGAVAYLPQDLQLRFAYSVLDVVLMGRARQVGLFAVPAKADEAAAAEALARVGLTSLATRPFDQISGGERRLVMFARALATGADVLVLDEPCSALDLRNQGIILSWIKKLAHDGLTVVFTTHQPQHADAVADDALLMFNDHRYVFGTAAETMTDDPLSALFDTPLRRSHVVVDGEDIETVVPIWRL